MTDVKYPWPDEGNYPWDKRDDSKEPANKCNTIT